MSIDVHVYHYLFQLVILVCIKYAIQNNWWIYLHFEPVSRCIETKIMILATVGYLTLCRCMEFKLGVNLINTLPFYQSTTKHVLWQSLFSPFQTVSYIWYLDSVNKYAFQSQWLHFSPYMFKKWLFNLVNCLEK